MTLIDLQGHFSYISLKISIACLRSLINPLMGTGNYSSTLNNMKLVHWPVMGELLHLVQRGGDWVGPQPDEAPPRCTKCNCPPINGQGTNHRFALRFYVPIKGLSPNDLTSDIADDFEWHLKDIPGIVNSYTVCISNTQHDNVQTIYSGRMLYVSNYSFCRIQLEGRLYDAERSERDLLATAKFIVFLYLCFSSRLKVTHTLTELMEYSQRLSLFCQKWSKHCGHVEQFARSLFIWRKPAPQFQRSKVLYSECCDLPTLSIPIYTCCKFWRIPVSVNVYKWSTNFHSGIYVINKIRK